MQLICFNLCSIVIGAGKSIKADRVCVSRYRPSFQSIERVRTLRPWNAPCPREWVRILQW